ncbi:RNA polymerase sigma factor RpoH [Phenylobacterium sp.]|uniref:RNA polymerase sigma factor RpoH n=1 Tax=Phenylobacterium sp. TaxID=1871053 RepID=UPI002CB14809|nr:RNA polymerase sigma factor RpoH [Phenylobacterium sp.]HLZ73753.1 RNA polymerase sigma factor RpoH [Phenylobacterium sp.]
MQAAVALSTEQGLGQYLRQIREMPMLQPQDEYMLARRWQEHQDPDAAQRLITSHLRLVAKVAMGYRGYGLPVSDLISEGNIGLMQAVRRFDPDRGFRLATYAMWWIRSTIQEFVIRSWSLVKMGTTGAQKKLFFGLRRAKQAISALEDANLRPEQAQAIAERLGVLPQEVVEMNQRMAGDNSLNAPMADAEMGGAEWQDQLADQAASPEAELIESQETDYRRQALTSALTTLSPRERAIFEARHLREEAATYGELSELHGVSRERVRQIEARAFAKVQSAVLGRPIGASDAPRTDIRRRARSTGPVAMELRAA